MLVSLVALPCLLLCVELPGLVVVVVVPVVVMVVAVVLVVVVVVAVVLVVVVVVVVIQLGWQLLFALPGLLVVVRYQAF